MKIGDLGVAKLLGTSNSFAATVVGTPYYLSPELVQDQPYGKSSDMWALGVVTYMLLSGKRPFHHQDKREKARMIRHDPLRFPRKRQPLADVEERGRGVLQGCVPVSQPSYSEEIW